MSTYQSAAPAPARQAPAAGSRLAAGRAVARTVKLASASAAVAGLGLFALLARATHPGASAGKAAASTALAAPASFVTALDSGLAPGSLGSPGGAPQAQTHSS